VLKAQVSGRTDSDCQQYLGQPIHENLSNSNGRFELKKGQKIKINVLIKDYKGIPASTTFSSYFSYLINYKIKNLSSRFPFLLNLFEILEQYPATLFWI